MLSWHIWVIKQGKFSEVSEFLSTLTEVKEFLYPTMMQEYRSARGGIKCRRVPLYSGYVFINYDMTPETHQKLRAFPFLTTYVGRCGKNDLEFVSKAKETEYLNTITRMFGVGDTVRVTCGPFKGFEGSIEAAGGGNVTVSINVFGRPVKTSFSKDDVDVVVHVSRAG